MNNDALAGFKPNIIGINQIVWDPASLTLFAESDQHLDQRSNYLLVVTRGIHDASGAPILRAQGLNSGDTVAMHNSAPIFVRCKVCSMVMFCTPLRPA